MIVALPVAVAVVVVVRATYPPLFPQNPSFPLNVDHSANVVLRRQHKLVVQHPLRLVLEDARGVEGHRLVVLDGEVEPRALQVSDLHSSNAQQSNRETERHD